MIRPFAFLTLGLAVVASVTAPRAQDLPEPAYEAYDFFVIAGQSNAKGRGDAPLSPAVASGVAYEALPTGEVIPLADPVGGAVTGSAWPAFANAYTAATGRGVVVVGLATSGSVQVALDGDGGNKHWDVRTEDNLYTRNEVRARRALAAAEEALPGVSPAGWLWIQGGSDARRIDDGRLTPDAYALGLRLLSERIADDWAVPLYLFVSGTDARGDSPGFVALRDEQNAADSLSNVMVVYRDAYTFPERGWMQPDNVHWAQPGLDEAGTTAGPIVGANRLATLPPPPVPREAVVLYPNPARERATVDAGCAFRFEVLDPLGRKLAIGRGDGPTLLPALPAGTYLVRVRPRAGTQAACSGTRRLVITR